MSFLKKIKSALGFSNDQEFDDPGIVEALPTVHPNIVPDAPVEVSEEMMMKIFDKVVEVTNASLPGYLSSSVNTEKQKKYLYDALDQSVKQYLIELDSKAQAKCIALWQSERDELGRQMETLKQRAIDLETKRNEVNEQKLSSENQRRALTERVRVLDETVLKLEAEKEQLEIENRGLINKAKVAQVYESDIENMRQELEVLRASVSPEAASAEVERLQAEITRHQSEIAQLQNENTNMKESCDAAKVKSCMSDAMIKDLQKRTSELVQTVRNSEQTIKTLTDEISVKEAQIADLHQKIEEKDARLAEDEDMFEEFGALSDQMALFEDVKKRLQEKIAQLKDELKKAQDENGTLRQTIEDTQNENARNQQAMQQTIEQLRNKNQTPLSSEDLAIDTDAM